MLAAMTAPSLSLADARLRDAVEAVYRLFAAPTPDRIEGCPCCIGKRRVDILLRHPLGELTGQQLWGYVSGVFLTVGSEKDFRYLLPRILEISASDLGDASNPEIVLGKLRRANWRSWPADEWRAVEDVIHAWFDCALGRDLSEAGEGWIGDEAESVLCGAARAGLSVTPFLARLLAADAAPILADLRQRHPDALSCFWEDEPEGLRAFAAFLTQERTDPSPHDAAGDN